MRVKKRVYLLFASIILIVFIRVIYAFHSQEKASDVLSAARIVTISPSIPPESITPLPTDTPTVTASPSPSLTPSVTYTGYCIGVPVLLYHHIQPGGVAKVAGQTSLTVDNKFFEQQMQYISSVGYTTIFAEELVNALRSHTPLPPKSIVVTLDDGYQDAYEYAYPILKQFHVKATFMIPTGLINVNSGSNAYLSWSELKEMVDSGFVSVGNHTWSHYPMGTKSADKDQYEVSTAQQQLLSNLGKPITVFTYPYGTNAGLQKVQTVLVNNGILGAFSTIDGTRQCDSFIFSLHRRRIGNTFFPSYGIQ